MNVVLTGFIGTGKTTIARLLAQKTGKSLVSTEEEISKKAKMSPGKFIEKNGMNKFYELEAEVVETISDFDDCIFDADYRILMKNENVISFKKTSVIIMLTADIKDVQERMKKKGSSWTKKSMNELEASIKDYESRCSKVADYIIDSSRMSPEDACDLIAHYVQSE
ncbi:MAG TPA: shikimate kinase [Candidatus Nanoarchaeia archaeon]|nr:shikimate kinase [Candidatus Nanoarchaeia archaeon]